jgi:antitoxin component YwqK of YwqJK toxin-antitoxin module
MIPLQQSAIFIVMASFVANEAVAQRHFIFKYDSNLIKHPEYVYMNNLPPGSHNLILREGIEDGDYYYCPNTKKGDTSSCKKDYVLKGTILNGQMDGELKFYWPAICDVYGDEGVKIKIPSYSLSYRAGKLEGPYTLYNSPDDVVIIGHYRNNKLHGKQFTLIKEGFFVSTLVDVAEYYNDTLVHYEEFNSMGSIVFMKSYDLNAETGVVSFYGFLDTPQIIGYFKKDTLKSINYYRNDGSLHMSISGKFSRLNSAIGWYTYSAEYSHSANSNAEGGWLMGMIKLIEGKVELYKNGEVYFESEFTDIRVEEILTKFDVQILWNLPR